MLDERLSKPKVTKEDAFGKVFKNSAQPDQKLYQSSTFQDNHSPLRDMS
jgi:hypothetical protein